MPAFVAHFACNLAAKDGQTPTRSTTLNWQAVAKAYSDDVEAWFEESMNAFSLWSKTRGSSDGIFWVTFALWDFFSITVHFGPRKSNQTPTNQVRFRFFSDPHFDIRRGDPCFGTQLPAEITCAALCTAQTVILSGCDIPLLACMVTFRSLECLEIENCRFTGVMAFAALEQIKRVKKIRIRGCQNIRRECIGVVAYIRSDTDDGTETTQKNTPRDVTGRRRPWQSPNVGNAKLNVEFAEQKEHGRAVLGKINACVESFYADAGVTTGMKLVFVQGINVDHEKGFIEAMKVLRCALLGEKSAETIWLEFKCC
jgi:hypothetical protein